MPWYGMASLLCRIITISIVYNLVLILLYSLIVGNKKQSLRACFAGPELNQAARTLCNSVLVNYLVIDMSAVEPPPAEFVPMIRQGRPDKPTVPISNRGGWKAGFNA